MPYRANGLQILKMSDVKSDKFIWIVLNILKNIYHLNQYNLDCIEDRPSNSHSLIWWLRVACWILISQPHIFPAVGWVYPSQVSERHKHLSPLPEPSAAAASDALGVASSPSNSWFTSPWMSPAVTVNLWLMLSPVAWSGLTGNEWRRLRSLHRLPLEEFAGDADVRRSAVISPVSVRGVWGLMLTEEHKRV